MKKKQFTLLLILMLGTTAYTQNNIKKSSKPIEKIKVSKHLTLTKISEHTYIHTQKNNNGIVYFNTNEAIIVSTPNSDIETKNLIDWVKRKAKIVAYVIDRWHPDAMEGLDVVKKHKIKTYANVLTQEIAQRKGLVKTDSIFKFRKVIKVGNQKIICHYLGEAHTTDGIVVWLPSEKILFGGNEIRNVNGWVGNIGDANLKAWSKTAKKVKKMYGTARIVVPGHGAYGGPELIDYTIMLYDIGFKNVSKGKNVKKTRNPLGKQPLSITSKKDMVTADKRILLDAKLTLQDASKLVVITAPRIKFQDSKLQINAQIGRVQIYDKEGKCMRLRTDVNFKNLIVLNVDQTVGLVVILKEITSVNN